MSEELKDNPMECMRCDTCEACYTCQVGETPELRKYQTTTLEYLNPPSIEEMLSSPDYNKVPLNFKKSESVFVQWLKYIFLFKWLKVTWK